MSLKFASLQSSKVRKFALKKHKTSKILTSMNQDSLTMNAQQSTDAQGCRNPETCLSNMIYTKTTIVPCYCSDGSLNTQS